MENLYIVGHPVDHSKSPEMYNAAYEKLGLDWSYGKKDLPDHDAALEFLRSNDYLSVNITTPYKPDAFEAADALGATAKLAKGVNLLVNKEGKRIGYNVDGQGCVAYLERAGVTFKGKKVAVCGTGPTALSILHACAIAGAADVLLLGRDKERTRRILEHYVEDFRRLVSTAIIFPGAADGIEGHLSFKEAFEEVEFKFGTYETSTKAIAAADIVIDATILGMKEGDPSPFDTSLLSGGQVVMDTVYGHGTSALLAAAEKRGCKTFDGAGMLVSQAAITASIVCEVAGVDMGLSYDDLFDIMAKAADFNDL